MAISTITLAGLLDSTDSDTVHLSGAVAGLVRDLHTTIPSYCGFQLQILDHGWPVTLTEFTNTDSLATTSLTIDLDLLIDAAGPGSITFWASTPGALVDLAADLNHSLDQPSTTDTQSQPQIELDAALPPKTQTSGLSGVSELSTINRAVGFLIGQGHHPEDAHQHIRTGASSTKTPAHLFAAQLLHHATT